MDATTSKAAEYTATEVAAHKTAEDLWIIIHGEGQNVRSREYSYT